MNIFYKKNALRDALKPFKEKHLKIGLVPTMGALHDGHISLVKQALNACDVVVVSIFVNPTQFDNPDDLQKYPRTLPADTAMLSNSVTAEKVIVFAPSVEEVYGENPTSQSFDFGPIAKVMEGKYRDGHFDGVGTVLTKLFAAVNPHKAYFGEKDYQQLLIVKKLIEITHLPIEIIGCPIDREESGLARSSRNQRLTRPQKEQAAFIYQVLKELKNKFSSNSIENLRKFATQAFEKHPYLELEYLEIADAQTLAPATAKKPNKKYRAFIAVYAEPVRLIDNIALN